ncbi:hypothetical protein B0T10DRAFT_467635 [Thelonectria olida]|uniref:Mandelate racemase/muconate lactonizing enzyme N-terminal domain-containing protein n=1 Tax=Thelonectria olida TaxID=1576542 RepID=A0A9P8VP90_9HYPO|nr:hypothetical protein B0T10DRAFT_467635 [Thelonectria olida]
MYGWALDNTKEFQVVLGNGTITRTSHRANPTLYKALRGGGANFVVVTSFVLDTYRYTGGWGGIWATTIDHEDGVIDTGLWNWVQSSQIVDVWQNGCRTGFYRGGPVTMSALSGVDIALWDLKGKVCVSALAQYGNTNCTLAGKMNVPIFELLGGKVRTKLRVYASIGGDRPSEVEEHA